MMQRVHAPEKRSCCPSRQKESGMFAPRGFARRAEDNEQDSGPQARPPSHSSFAAVSLFPPVQAKPEPNSTGMPDRLKAGFEALSGIDMSDVRVHANSDKPTRLNALAYTQGNQIYMGPGQDRHLAHEAWHVVQQKQGRVRTTMQMKGLGINNEPSLEHEADVMGAKASKFVPATKEEILQGKLGEGVAQKAQNNTGRPDNLRAGIENLSRMSLDGVKVHYNSGKPTHLNALAYAQGTHVYVGPGQERHLPHEGRDVLQQGMEHSDSAPLQAAFDVKAYATVGYSINGMENFERMEKKASQGPNRQNTERRLGAHPATAGMLNHYEVGQEDPKNDLYACAEPKALSEAMKFVFNKAEGNPVEINNITVYSELTGQGRQDMLNRFRVNYNNPELDTGSLIPRCNTCATLLGPGNGDVITLPPMGVQQWRHRITD